MRGSETIQVFRDTKRDSLDDDGPLTTEPHHAVEGCIVTPRTSTEEGKGEVVIEGFNVFAPPGSDVLFSDQVELRGERYDVEGVPGDLRSARGVQKQLWVVLKRLGS